MPFSDTPMDVAARPAIGARCGGNALAHFIPDEPEWRLKPASPTPASSAPRVVATRWHALERRVREVSAETADNFHVVKIVLRNMSFRFSVSGRIVQDGTATPGMFHVTEPAAPSHCLFRGPYDTLHLHVPNHLIDECGRDMPCGRLAVLPSAATMTRDPIVERLGGALLEAEAVGNSCGPIYADNLSIAIVARLLAASQRVVPFDSKKVAGLSKWRLKRAVEYTEAHLAEPVSLADLASAAGLSRMHFAAQFKAATGLRPHEYLLRRRIERAQDMLARDEAPVIEIALSVGFQSQSHFTTVFRRITGQPPQAWRRSHLRCA